MRLLARRLALTLIGLMVVSASPLFAQEASIVGIVRDASGGVLPGVTVEAASPALIEKARTTITDGSGQYRITNLVPGTYSVTFSLTGFATLKQESIQVNTEITVTVNAEIKVGALEETVTVVERRKRRRCAERRGAHRHDARGDGRHSTRPQHPGDRHHDSGHGPAGRRRRRAVARCRWFRHPPAVAAVVSRLGGVGADRRRHAPQQPVRLGAVQRQLLE